MRLAGLDKFDASPELKSRIEANRLQADEEALTYLRGKFPEVDEEIFFTDHLGNRNMHVTEASMVCKAGRIERTCAQCTGECTLTNKSGKPIVSIEESPFGVKHIVIRWTYGMLCRYNPLQGDFGRLIHKSGLTKFQLRQTFETYETNCAATKRAKTSALLAAANGTCLMISGKRGTGKTHLAVATAISVMRMNRQAIFRLVTELLNEIRQAVAEGTDYFSLIQKFKEVPCLILDDFGKEKSTEAGLDYLYQILDYRYRNELQTVITTNAMTIEELASWGNDEYTTPIVSRIMEFGEWITLANVDDYRMKRGGKKNV